MQNRKNPMIVKRILRIRMMLFLKQRKKELVPLYLSTHATIAPDEDGYDRISLQLNHRQEPVKQELSFEFFLNGTKLLMNSANSENLRNH